MTRTSFRKCWTFIISHWLGRPSTQFARVAPYEIWVFPTNFIFSTKLIVLQGKKRSAHFQTYDWEKSSFFNLLIPVFGQINATMWGGGGVNRVKVWTKESFHDIVKVLYSFKCNCTANVFLAFYHFRVAVAEYAIDGVPEMNMRLFLRTYPSEEANDSTMLTIILK